jgi:inosine-uridine nucleoside N-ribohydrolase
VSSNRKKVIIDTDPGIDDAIALCYAMLHPDIEVVALTTVFGNVDVPLATDNAARLCHLTQTAAPISAGAAAPLHIEPNPHAYYVHGDNGFGNVSLPLGEYTATDEDAATSIVRHITARPGEITLVAVGPLTNIALALQLEPRIADQVDSVVVMGGVFNNPGNVTPFAEANAWNDPHAAEVVFNADWPLVVLGLDITHQVSFNREFFDELAVRNALVGGFLHDCAEYYIEFYEQRSQRSGCCPHDQLALTYLTNPQWFQCEPVAIDVVTTGEQIGRTVATAQADSRRLIGKQVDTVKLQDDYLKVLSG